MFAALRRYSPLVTVPFSRLSMELSFWEFSPALAVTMNRSFWARTMAAMLCTLPGLPSSLPFAHQSVITIP